MEVTTLSQRRTIVVFALLLATTSNAQDCGRSQLAFVAPTEGDRIVVSVRGGRPAFEAFASIDSTGRVVYLPDTEHPEDAIAAMLGASLFDRLLAEAQEAADADQARLESDAPDTSTLEGLLEAVRRGSVGCSAHMDGTDHNVSLYLAEGTTHYECVAFQLAEFSRYFFGVVRDAVASGGRRLCP